MIWDRLLHIEKLAIDEDMKLGMNLNLGS